MKEKINEFWYNTTERMFEAIDHIRIKLSCM